MAASGYVLVLSMLVGEKYSCFSNQTTRAVADEEYWVGLFLINKLATEWSNYIWRRS
jgi:hypothetical protein